MGNTGSNNSGRRKPKKASKRPKAKRTLHVVRGGPDASRPRSHWCDLQELCALGDSAVQRLLEASAYASVGCDPVERGLRDMILVVLGTGLTLDELLDLEVEDVDLLERAIVTRASSSRPGQGFDGAGCRRIPLGPRLQEILVWHMCVEDEEDDVEDNEARMHGPVFPGDRFGDSIDREDALHALENACRHAGLTGVTWGTLRNTFLALLARTPMPEETDIGGSRSRGSVDAAVRATVEEWVRSREAASGP